MTDPHFLNTCRQEWALAYKASKAKSLSDEQWLAAFWSVEKSIHATVQYYSKHRNEEDN